MTPKPNSNDKPEYLILPLTHIHNTVTTQSALVLCTPLLHYHLEDYQGLPHTQQNQVDTLDLSNFW